MIIIKCPACNTETFTQNECRSFPVNQINYCINCGQNLHHLGINIERIFENARAAIKWVNRAAYSYIIAPLLVATLSLVMAVYFDYRPIHKDFIPMAFLTIVVVAVLGTFIIIWIGNKRFSNLS